MLEKHGRVQPRSECTPRTPAELVVERIAGRLGRWQPATPRDKGRHLGALRLSMVEDLHGPEMVDTGVQAKLIQDRDASRLGPASRSLWVRS